MSVSAIVCCHVAHYRLHFYHKVSFNYHLCFIPLLLFFLFHCLLSLLSLSVFTFITFTIFFSYAWFHNYVELCVVLISWGCQNIDPVDPGDKCTNAQYNNDICRGKSGINWLSLDFMLLWYCFSVVVSVTCFTPIKIRFPNQK